MALHRGRALGVQPVAGESKEVGIIHTSHGEAFEHTFPKTCDVTFFSWGRNLSSAEPTIDLTAVSQD
jgi:hypothetical protein